MQGNSCRRLDQPGQNADDQRIGQNLAQEIANDGNVMHGFSTQWLNISSRMMESIIIVGGGAETIMDKSSNPS